MSDLSQLNDEQRRAASYTAGPALILAGAGTGKTSTMENHISYCVANGINTTSEILAISFTRDAAKELTERTRKRLGPFKSGDFKASTFHSLGMRLLKSKPEIAGLSARFRVADPDDAIVYLKEAITKLLDEDGCYTYRGQTVPIAGPNGGISKDITKPVQDKIAKWKQRGMRPTDAVPPQTEEERYRDQDAEYQQSFVQKIYPLYQDILRENNKADFGDMLLWPVKAMEENEDIRLEWADQWKRIIVDEYQDTNKQQNRLISLLGKDHRNVVCVGDDDQAIFSFQGAEVGYILAFEKAWPGAEIFKLVTNYRCSGNILAAANAVIAQNKDRRGKDLEAHKEGGDRLNVITAANTESLADYVAKNIQEKTPKAYILYRNNWESRIYEEGLIDAGINYEIVGDSGFYGREEIKDVLAYLKLATMPSEMEDTKRIINKPARGIGDKTYEQIKAYAEEKELTFLKAGLDLNANGELPEKAGAGLKQLIDSLEEFNAADIPLADRMAILLERVGYILYWEASDDPKNEDRLKNITEFYSAINDKKPFEVLERARKAQSKEKANAPIKLMTFHKSKGLEEEAVYLADWQEGIFPSTKAVEALDKGITKPMEEERRLAYVAITRAIKHLYILKAGPPTRFLGDIPPDLLWQQRAITKVQMGKKPTPAALDYAKAIAEGLNKNLQEEEMACAYRCSEFIDNNKKEYWKKRDAILKSIKTEEN